MEKYRKFADAPTGIQPFVSIVSPAKKTMILTFIMFPMRLLFCTVFFALILLSDIICYVFYSLYLSFIPKLLLLELLRHFFLRGFFFFLGHVLPRAAMHHGSNVSHHNGTGKSSTQGTCTHRLRRGDVLIVNLQSPWDAMIIEAALSLPYYAVAFPCLPTTPSRNTQQANRQGRSSSSSGREKRNGTPIDVNGAKRTKNGNGAGMEERRVKVFLPGPFQRWRVFYYILYTSSPKYLESQSNAVEAAATGDGGNTSARHSDGESSSSSGAMINLGLHAQYSANRYGVPLLYFLEGTCSNGKGILSAPSFSCYEAGAFQPSHKHHTNVSGADSHQGNGSEKESTHILSTASIIYETPALATVLPQGKTLFPLLYRASCLLYGSGAGPAWSSPFFPHAYVCVQSCRLEDEPSALRLSGSPSSSVTPSSASQRSNPLFQVQIAEENLLAVRQSLCRVPRGIPIAGGVVRKPLTVGLKEKLGYVKAVREKK